MKTGINMSKDRINNIFEFVSQNGEKYNYPHQFIINEVIVSEFIYGKNMSSRMVHYKSDRIVLDNINGTDKIIWLTSDKSLLDTIESILNLK
jgi:hypothetical protein